MTAEPPAPPTPASDAAPAAPAPSIDLGPSFEAVAFAPGRYALAIQRSQRGTHARNRVRESSTMSFVLELAADGAATACRGWDYAMTNDGPTVATEDRFREQHGFRGRYTVRDGLAHAELTADASVCAPIAEYLNGVPRRATAMALRCVLAAPRGGSSSVTNPVLLCDWQDPDAPEIAFHRVAEVAPRPWIILGSGNGLRIKVTGAPPSMIGDPIAVRAEPAPARIEADAWQKPF
jgi:hypothetical protein